MSAAVFAAPSLEGAKLALKDLLAKGNPDLRSAAYCAVAIDVFTSDDVLLQRSLAHADVAAPVRDAFRELVDHSVTRFAETQRLDEPGGARRGAGDPYRGGGGAWNSNDFHGFDCGYALAVARSRVAKLNASLRSAADMDVRLYAVPFLHVAVVRGRQREEVVVMRRDDGAYRHEAVA